MELFNVYNNDQKKEQKGKHICGGHLTENVYSPHVAAGWARRPLRCCRG